MSRLDRLEEKLDKIIELLTVLVIKERTEVSAVPDNPIHFDPLPGTSLPSAPNTPYNFKTCSKCGLKLEGSMLYSCSNVDCPTGLGPITR